MLHVFIPTDRFVICCQIHSDQQAHTKVEYYLTGPGADQPPVNLFVVDRGTGSVRITGVVDREQYPFFNVSSCCDFPKRQTGLNNSRFSFNDLLQ